MDDYRRAILTEAAEHRRKEVIHHQINIDNYTLALAEIKANHAGEVHMDAFADRLRDLLQTSVEEQQKEKVMLKVITSQLE